MIQVWAGNWQLFNMSLKKPILRGPQKDLGWFSDLIIPFTGLIKKARNVLISFLLV